MLLIIGKVYRKTSDEDKKRAFQKRILEWGKKNIIMYPWEKITNSYEILIAEILLHRTKAEQVLPVYREFIRKYPDVDTLYKSSYEDVEEILYPLGLRWRVKLLHEMARILVEKFNSEIPEDYSKLLSLPGVSDYIASAVRCFAFGYPEPILDTNTVRVVGRVFGVQVADSTRRSSAFRNFMKSLVPKKDPKTFNYALLDFGKTVCKARFQCCDSCILAPICATASKRAKKSLFGKDDYEKGCLHEM